MRLIADGVVDQQGVPGLAARLGYSVRQLERLLRAELGAGPIAIARAQRAQTARVLIETTAMPMAEIAFAAGFSSIRQFNDTIRSVFALDPSGLRARATTHDSTPVVAPAGLILRLPFRLPLCADNLFGHLAATAVPGVEEVRDGAYRRTLRLNNGYGVIALTPAPNHIACQLWLSDLRDLTTAITRCRWLLDLDADPAAVDEVLRGDPNLRPLVAHAPGRRVPRSVDGAEMALRAVLGQQVSTTAARTWAGRVVTKWGERVTDPAGGLTHLFPAPEALQEMELALPAGRSRSLAALVESLCSGRLQLGPGCDRDAALSVLADLPGVGPWTAQIIAMRALGDPDAFVATDLGVRRAAAALGLPETPTALTARAARWRPWRAYAVQYLWSALDHPINRWQPALGTLPVTLIKEAS
jgi:AraC family transcriptional regulator of adaptative response / DNA-3-methyladenine glycosylase II